MTKPMESNCGRDIDDMFLGKCLLHGKVLEDQIPPYMGLSRLCVLGVMRDIERRGGKIDIEPLTDGLKAHDGLYEELGGAKYIVRLIDLS